MENKTKNCRIRVLDGFRALAILMVIFFHYFSRWNKLYPYGNKYDFFVYGKMGVQFFFIISGFVILHTLENTTDFVTFWKKRVIRLFPSMLIASIITYFIFVSFDTELLFPASHFFKNILASITFIPPDSLASLFNNKMQLDYISGSYWSLWPEIQFYLFVSIVYFYNKKKFQFVFLNFTFILIFSNFILHHIYNDNQFIKTARIFFTVFNFIESLPYFCFGMLFYLIYKNKILKRESHIYLKMYLLGLLVFQIYGSYLEPLKLALIFLFLLLFMALIYYPMLINFLENKFFVKIGVSSYFLYLIHENVGVLILHKYGGFLTAYQFIIPIILIVFLIAISLLYTYSMERKIGNYLKKIILKKEKIITKCQMENLDLKINDESA